MSQARNLGLLLLTLSIAMSVLLVSTVSVHAESTDVQNVTLVLGRVYDADFHPFTTEVNLKVVCGGVENNTVSDASDGRFLAYFNSSECYQGSSITITGSSGNLDASIFPSGDAGRPEIHVCDGNTECVLGSGRAQYFAVANIRMVTPAKVEVSPPVYSGGGGGSGYTTTVNKTNQTNTNLTGLTNSSDTGNLNESLNASDIAGNSGITGAAIGGLGAPVWIVIGLIVVILLAFFVIKAYQRNRMYK